MMIMFLRRVFQTCQMQICFFIDIFFSVNSVDAMKEVLMVVPLENTHQSLKDN
jgi:hypothetical protein